MLFISFACNSAPDSVCSRYYTRRLKLISLMWFLWFISVKFTSTVSAPVPPPPPVSPVRWRDAGLTLLKPRLSPLPRPRTCAEAWQPAAADGMTGSGKKTAREAHWQKQREGAAHAALKHASFALSERSRAVDPDVSAV